MQTFVTGGTGLLGHTLVRLLVSEGHDVKALVRSARKADRLLGDLDVETVVGDMRAVEAFEHELEGCEVLFHTAAYFREYYQPGDHWELLRAVNVNGTVDLLSAADRHGVARVVYMSSSGVVAPRSVGLPGDESTLLDPAATDNLYFRSKVLAEQAVDDFLATHDLSVIRILPGWLFGPRDAGPTASGQFVLDFLHRDLPGVFEGGGQVTDVRDVAWTTIDAVYRGVPGERYVVAGDYVRLVDIAATLAALTGIPAPRTVPYPFVAALARLSALYDRITGRQGLLSPAGVDTLRRDDRVNSRKAVAELGATFRALEETLRDTVKWYLAHGFVNGDVAFEITQAGRLTAPDQPASTQRPVAGER
jgi:dihydroflavonol-4-reductase